jgi:hypothetical protein
VRDQESATDFGVLPLSGPQVRHGVFVHSLPSRTSPLSFCFSVTSTGSPLLPGEMLLARGKIASSAAARPTPRFAVSTPVVCSPSYKGFATKSAPDAQVGKVQNPCFISNPNFFLKILISAASCVFLPLVPQNQISKEYTIVDHTYDAVVVGAGGAGNACYRFSSWPCFFVYLLSLSLLLSASQFVHPFLALYQCYISPLSLGLSVSLSLVALFYLLRAVFDRLLTRLLCKKKVFARPSV